MTSRHGYTNVRRTAGNRDILPWHEKWSLVFLIQNFSLIPTVPLAKNVIFSPKNVRLATPLNPQPFIFIHETFPKSGVKMSQFRRVKSCKTAAEIALTYHDIRRSWFVGMSWCDGVKMSQNIGAESTIVNETLTRSYKLCFDVPKFLDETFWAKWTGNSIRKFT